AQGVGIDQFPFPRPSLPGVIRQSMPTHPGNEKPCNRKCSGMDAMIKSWQDQCGVGVQANPHSLFVIAGLDPAIHAISGPNG
ncbi:MAG: hypothetical protein AAFY05_23235, partial [Pseudomonadota bacterium]